MEQAVKQRLVGAAVLTAIAVITLPMIFDTERPPAVQVPETVPPRPETPNVAMPAPQPVELPPDRPSAEPVPVGEMYQLGADQPDSGKPDTGKQADASEALESDAVAPADTATAVPPPAKPASPKAAPAARPVDPLPAAPGGKLDAHGVPESWVVQVAAMSDRKRVETLVAELKLNGHTAFTTVTHEAGGDTIRVFVGPKLDKAQAQRTKQQLDRELGLQTIVKPFSPR